MSLTAFIHNRRSRPSLRRELSDIDGEFPASIDSDWGFVFDLCFDFKKERQLRAFKGLISLAKINLKILKPKSIDAKEGVSVDFFNKWGRRLVKSKSQAEKTVLKIRRG